MTCSDEVLLVTLLNKVRWLTLEQTTRVLEATSPIAVRRRVHSLIDAGLLRRVQVFLPRTEAMHVPIAIWKPGGAAPEFGALAYRTAKRWSGPVKGIAVVLATRRAAQLLGGHAGRIQPAARAHDLHVSELYLRLRRDRPADASDWVSEAALCGDREGQVLPDALIVNSDGSARIALELVGHYRVQRLERFHRDCVARDLPYELW